ncbi:3-oxoacyl-[acyl-carrier-protein] reductase FabG-like [Galleria mellonella]|uniref:3-oxoacyl-[acyl-carrier-protein] reductase FabG-like n=1 Tax=Galleria mellonella TaxID=7137 RepID=A0A6J1WNP9_GALME|nr:3-oxoacyl-[acyl-carrier-protein] reductase FabG-like [Galleria mellonella]XP_052751833.1 3-oxoacyl-[acyl-carrier-protein] reductase FabG-like [Galleria mellonella]
MSFTNKVVVVTGAGSGIGAAAALQFAAEGARVVLVDRDEARLRDVRAQCPRHDQELLLLAADIAREDEPHRIIQETVNKFGKLDVLVNCAAIFRVNSGLDENIMETYDEVMNVNLRALVLLTTLAAPHLVESKGNIVNISSVAAVMALGAENAVYSISKAGVEHFTRGAALELAASGVRVNAVRPGPVRTRIAENCGRDMNCDDWSDLTKIGRISEPQEIADTILFLANDKAKGITGSIFTVDNGMVF